MVESKFHQIKEKECYWIPHPSKVYTLIMVQSIEGDQCFATTVSDNRDIELDIPDCPFYPVNPYAVDDMTSLHHLHEAGILANLAERSKLTHQMPYTYVANVLIAVNPLRQIPDANFEMYRGKPISACPPHPYGVAEMAYRQMTLPRISNRNQSIIISGESGAGKTETAKIVLRYLCWRCAGAGMTVENKPPPRRGSVMLMETPPAPSTKALDHRLLQSNHVLEAFGNAKTIRNDNSSRFGKFMKLNFDDKNDFRLISAGIDTYLLEKSRVVHVSEGERNYHVFYQMLRGASPVEKKKWRLKDVSGYRYLSQSSMEAIDDKANYKLLCSGLAALGVTRILAAVLCLGNIDFFSEEKNGEEAAYVIEPFTTTKAAQMLGVELEALENVLLTKLLDMTAADSGNTTPFANKRRLSNIRSPRNVAQAEFARDAMAKSIYQRVFDWVVSKVVESLGTSAAAAKPFIGVLDIFGFECFESNSLEQLLINYANESLQVIFNKSILVAEQQLFIEEGLQVENIVFTDNSGCVELISTGSNCIISLLDSACVIRATDEKFLATLQNNKYLSTHPHFPAAGKLKTSAFLVKHYASVVTYTIGSFVVKNTDARLNELSELLSSSSHNTKCSIFAADAVPTEVTSFVDNSDDPEVDDQLAAAASGDRPASMSRLDVTKQRLYRRGLSNADLSAVAADALAPSTPSTPKRKQMHRTVAGNFVKKMSELRVVLEGTACSFIRCVKPNPTMTLGHFDYRCVVEQLRCLGVVQTCEVLKAGLPTRIAISDVEDMYKPLLPTQLHGILSTITEHGLLKAVMWAFQIPTECYKIGKTKLFFRMGQISHLSELTPVDPRSEKGILLSKRLSHFVTRLWWRKTAAIRLCQSALLDLFSECRVRRKAAGKIERAWFRFTLSAKQTKRKLLRRKWRIAILYIRCQLLFVADYLLIKESRAMRQQAEAAAEANMRQLEQAELRRKAEAADAAMKLEITTVEKLSGRRRTFSEEDSREALETATSALRENQEAKARSEMQALVAASGLATVSVCLFRWMNIRVYAAFEKWIAVMPHLEPSATYKANIGNFADRVKATRTLRRLDTTDLNTEGTPLTAVVEEELDTEEDEVICGECNDRVGVIWCKQCSMDYCKVCSQFVHSSCVFMRSHTPGDERPDDAPPPPVASNGSSAAATPPRKRVSMAVPPVTGAKTSPTTRRKSVRKSIKPTATVVAGDEIRHHHDPCAIKSCDKEATRGVSIRFCEEHYEEFRGSMKTTSTDADEHKTLQQQVALLKKQLQESGQQPVEFVELSVARERMQAAVQRLMGGDEGAEKDIERWDKAIRMNPEYQKEMEEKSKQWELDQLPKNMECLRRMRCLIPNNVAQTSVSKMMADGVPKSIANRIWTKKALWMICMHPDDMKRMHIADLTTKYGNQGLDIIEMRAIWANLPTEFDNDGDGKKAQWRALFRQKLEELTTKETGNRLSNMEKRNPAYKGYDNLTIYDPDIEVKRLPIQKSTAFDATEKPEISSSLGDGIKELRKQMQSVEKPHHDGNLIVLASSGDTGGSKMWGVLLLKKRVIVLYTSLLAAKEGDENTTEINIEKHFTVKSGPGSMRFCLYDGEKEVQAFETDKDKRDKWVESINEVLEAANKVLVVRKSDAAAEAPAEEEAPRPPKPSFLAGIQGKRGESEDAPPAKPSFLAGIQSKKRDSEDVSPAKPSFLAGIQAKKRDSDVGDAKPSFLAGIQAKKKADDGDAAAKPSFLAGIQARKQRDSDAADAKPSFLASIQAKKLPEESGGLPPAGPSFLASIQAKRKEELKTESNEEEGKSIVERRRRTCEI